MQGGVISPLLANIYLHPLDKLMTERGQRITRYADDFVICCKTQKGAERVLKSVVRFLRTRAWIEGTSGENENSEQPRRAICVFGVRVSTRQDATVRIKRRRSLKNERRKLHAETKP